MSWAVVSPLAIVGSALVLVGLERLFPYDRNQRVLRDGFWTDLVGYAIVQSYVLGLVIKHLIEAIDRATGLSHWGLVSAWPVPVQLAFFFVTHDLYIYVFHRCQHRFPILWRLHEAHHSPEQVDWLSGARSHALEILVNQTIEFAPLVLLGAAPELALIKATIDAVWGMYIHANLDVRSGWLQRVINGPEMHRWHHAQEVIDINFSTKLAVWDWLFGTAHLPPTKPRQYGVRDERVPDGYFAQQLFAFRGFTKPAPATDAADGEPRALDAG